MVGVYEEVSAKAQLSAGWCDVVDILLLEPKKGNVLIGRQQFEILWCPDDNGSSN